MDTREQSMPEEADKKHDALLYKEWDEASCPICMDHPHNAVLLLCSSHDKGCRSYICDTSYRHSNCLDRFNKQVPEKNFQFPPSPKPNLKCPLCRGDVFGWKVIEEARAHLNLKLRNCSRESCSYVGNYKDLRLHARRAHPTVRPTEVDPTRERAWRSLEEQREYDDIISAVRTAMPGAMVLGDYVVENGGDRTSTFFLVRMFGSSRHRRPNRSLPRHRFLWGQSLLGLQDERRNEEDNVGDFDGMTNLPPVRRRRQRRRLM